MSVPQVSSLALGQPAPSVQPQLRAPPGSKSFAGLLREKISKLDSIVGEQAFHDLMVMRQRAMSAKEISPKDLILYQIKSSEFGLGVELLSKVAESVSTTVRKFQSNQG